MADFRKSILLTAMAFAVGVGTASAQSPSCTAAAGAIPTLRTEGQAELVGSIILNCVNIAGGQSTDVAVLLNGGTLPITSRESPSEANLYLTINGVTTATAGTFLATSGSVINEVTFTIPALAANTPALQITINGIRANVNSVIPAGGIQFGSVFATVTTNNAVLPITEPGGGFFVGVVMPGLGPISATGSTVNVSSCGGGSPVGADTNFVISIPEGFSTAFLPQGPVPNSASETSQQFGALQAESATQFAVTFNNIPSGVTFYIPETITSTAGGSAYLVSAGGSVLPLAGAYIVGNASPLLIPTTDPNNTLLFLPVTNATTVYYNVYNSNPSLIESFTIPTYLQGQVAAPTTVVPTVAITLAPLAVVNGAQQINVPRFLALSTEGLPYNLPGFSATGCQTTLLFPYVTNLAGFDTGISIAATNKDPFGTFIQGGSCVISLYGESGIPAAPPSLVVPAGGEGHTTISTIAPGFQGYLIVECPFQYAHGYAFLSNGFSGVGNGGLSEGYLALEIGNTRLGTPSTAVINGAGGESLGH